LLGRQRLLDLYAEGDQRRATASFPGDAMWIRPSAVRPAARPAAAASEKRSAADQKKKAPTSEHQNRV